jgi:hypothetical protein
MSNGADGQHGDTGVSIDAIGESFTPTATQEDVEQASDFALDMREQCIADRERLTNSNIRLDSLLRVSYARKLYRLVVGWLVFVGVFVVLASSPKGVFEVGGVTIVVDLNASDTLMVTMLATTTATVVGLFTVVATWMFPKRKGKDG